ncbi:MAG TPA: hypothetical protein VGF70_14370 [Solirubrobacteraceae bacterium]
MIVALAALAWHFNLPPRHSALDPVPDVLRAVAASIAVFGICGFGLVRLLLPAPLRRYEPLWVLPTGACAAGLGLTVLGFAAIPFAVSLPLILVAGVALGWLAVRRRGWPRIELPALGWPVYLAVAMLFVALVPLVLIQHYAAPVGEGSDAHVAAGVAQFLTHSYPTGTDVSQPINQMQPTWQSKYPIYYAYAAISGISGLATWQVLSILAAFLLALTAVGFFLVAREVFLAQAGVALVAMGLAALDREALQTILHPYFNQTWGFFALPFTLVTGWWAVHPGLTRPDRQRTIALLVIFALVLVLAYPLAAPIPAVPLIVFAYDERRRRVQEGRRVFRFADLYRGRRSLLWLVPAAALLAVPVAGAFYKAGSAVNVLLPGHSLADWGGDMRTFIPWNWFFSLPGSAVGWVLLVGVLGLAAWGLARQRRSLALGLGGLLILALLLALYFRHRQSGYYFEFKLLAFVGPLTLLIAAVGAARLRRVGVAVLAALSVLVAGSAVAQIRQTGYQLPRTIIQLADWARSLPAGASIRLDIWPPLQLWGAYFLASRPVCSEHPLINTDYPHVAFSVKSDYILTTWSQPVPADATGPPVRANDQFRLFRQKASVPGPTYCTTRRYDRLYTGAGHEYR